MTRKINITGSRLLLAVFCISIILASGMPSASGEETYQQISSATQAIDTSVPDRAHCVSMGYLYTTKPSLNSGKPVCQFPDGSWCDAHAFFTGNCSSSGLSSPYNPSFYSNSQGALDIAAGTKECQRLGGGVQGVHTAYGDVNLCVFPDGSTMDLRALANGAYGYYGPYSTYPYRDNWYYYAYSWLNAP
ncbi:MAG: hypothetical protein A4E48_02605 [Methanosaeta sp. PtaU1.Bin060]|nr:MAG: hypothetical protein A4E48_02605 [Methanosaeta sp. PtaU1.Bin060]